VKPVLEMLKQVDIKGLAHITGGGFIENIPRVLPANVNADIRLGSWPIPPIFSLLEREGGLTHDDLYRTFNMGIGMIAIVSEEQADAAVRAAEAAGEAVYRIGTVTDGAKEVSFSGTEV